MARWNKQYNPQAPFRKIAGGFEHRPMVICQQAHRSDLKPIERFRLYLKDLAYLNKQQDNTEEIVKAAASCLIAQNEKNFESHILYF